MLIKLGIFLYALLVSIFFLIGIFFLKTKTKNKSEILKALGLERIAAGSSLTIAVFGKCLGWEYYLLGTGIILFLGEMYLIYKIFINGKK